MAYCDKCGNYDSEHEYDNSKPMDGLPDDSLYFYWDYPLEENYDWRGAEPECDCLCEICFDILNSEGKIKWKSAS
tara:strand:- start:253 stop:477 length:225 start_codon:yes stop_codon:yes gene_type:complete